MDKSRGNVSLQMPYLRVVDLQEEGEAHSADTFSNAGGGDGWGARVCVWGGDWGLVVAAECFPVACRRPHSVLSPVPTLNTCTPQTHVHRAPGIP
jgi:hypothetical protein